MREISRYLVAVAAMMIALVWSLAQESPRVDTVARPLPTIASTLETSSVQN